MGEPRTIGDKHTVTIADPAPANCTITLSATESENAAEGTDFTFDVEPAANYKITAVSYTVTGGKENEALTVTNGLTKQTYTIPGADIIGDVTVTATAAEQKKVWTNISSSDEWQLTELSPLPTKAGTTYITVKQIGEYAAFSTDGSTYYSAAEGSLDGNVLAFVAEPKEGYQFKSNNNNEHVKVGLYAQKNSNWAANIREGIFATYVAQSGSVPAHYEIDLGNTDIISSADFNLTNIAEHDSLQLSVWCDVEAASEEPKNTVSLGGDYSSGLANVTMTVQAGDTTLTAGQDATSYEIADTTKDLPVTVTIAAKDGKQIDQWIPALQYKKPDEADTAAKKINTTASTVSVEADGSIKYSFTIPKAALTSSLVLNPAPEGMTEIDVHPNEGSSCTYDMFTVSLNPSIPAGGKWTDKAIADEADSILYVPATSNLAVTIKAVDGFAFENVWWGKTAKAPAADKKTCTFTVSKVGDMGTSISIVAKAAYGGATLAPKTEGTGSADNTTGKKWTLAPRAEYVISATTGKESLTFGNATLSKSIEGVKVEYVPDTPENDEQTVTTGKWILTVGAVPGPANQTVDLKLYTGKDDTNPVDTLNLTLTAVTSSVTAIAGAKKVGEDWKIQQTIGTEKAYAVTPDAKVPTDVLNIKPIGDNDSLEAEFENNKLVIKTKATAAPKADAATIEIINTSDSDKVIATVKVETTKPAWAVDAASKGGAAPTVKLADATDIALKLDLTLPKNVTPTAPEGTKYYYKVTPKAQSKKDGFTYLETPTFVETSAMTTREELKVIDKTFGEGTDTKFDVTVQLLQYTVAADAATDGQPAGTGTLIAASQPVTVKGLATKAPYYADKITLKKTKEASNLYTGQTAVVATVDFGKNTTYNRDGDVNAWVDGNDANDSGDGKISVVTFENGARTVNNSQVTLQVGKNVTPGRYTVYVEQIPAQGIPTNAIQAKAALQINVVQGIKTIEAQSVPTIYVAAKADGKAKITPVYNGGTKEMKPKTAKAGYVLGTLNGQDFTQDDGTLANAGITVNNGNVVVKKGYTDGKITNNKFAVKVFAKDFDANDAEDIHEFEISTEKLAFGKIVLLEQEQGGNSYKVVTPGSDQKITITADKAAERYVRVLRADATHTETGITEADDLVEPDLYTLTLSKKNDVSLDSDQSLVAKKVVTDVAVKVLSNDGSKAKPTNDGMKFSIGYEAADAKLQLATTAAFADFGTGNTSAVTTPTAAVIKVKAVDADGNDLTDRLVDYKVSVSGAKIVENNGDKNNLNIEIVMSKKEAVLTLSDQKGTKDSKKEYKITNANFDAKQAPKVSLAKGQTLYAKYDNEQTIKFTVDKWVASKNGTMAAVKTIKVTAAPDKASQDLYDLIKSGQNTISVTEGTLSESAKTEIEITFNSTVDTDVIKNGILRFDFVDENDAVVTKTSADVKITTALLKKSYKLTNKYNMSTKDAAKVKLVASGKPAGVAKKQGGDDLDVTFTGILNANIKGEVNRFREAFDLDDGFLKLKDVAKAKKDYLKDTAKRYKGMNNLTGFVEYTVTYEDGTTENYTTQLTVNIDVDNAKKAAITGLKATPKPVMTASDMAPEIAVTNSKKASVNLVGAGYKVKSGTEYFEVDEAKSEFMNGIVYLKLKDGVDAPAAGKVEGTLTVIPEDSFYAEVALTKHNAAIAPDADDAAKKAYTDYLEANGIPLTFKIDVKAITTTKKVKVETKDSKPNFSSVEESEGTYTLKVPYTVAISASVSTIARSEATKNNKPVSPTWITFAKAADENKVNITINKAAYAKVVHDGGKDTKGYKLNGTAVDAVAVVTYTEAGAAKDELKFKVTPPKLKDAEIEATPDPEENIVVTVTPATASVKRGDSASFTAEVKIDGMKDDMATAAVVWSVAAAADGGTMTADTKFGNNADANKLTIAAAETATKLTVTATYAPENGGAKTGTATVTIPPTVQSVTIQKDGSNVADSGTEVTAGTEVEFTAVVTGLGLGDDDQKVTWSATSSDDTNASTIDASGKLTVNASATADSTIEVTATSVTDGTKSKSVTLTVKAADVTG